MPSAVIRADEVVIKNANGKKIQRRGTITGFRKGVLVLDSAGRKIKIPRSRIHEYNTEYKSSHLQADSQFAEHRYDAAMVLYRRAYTEEKRPWVKRKILSRVVQCQANSQRIDQACKNFAILFSQDPDSYYLAVAPLAWRDEIPSGSLRRRINSWLTNEQIPVLQLVSASWLFNSNRDEVIRLLRELGRSEDPSLASLAISQMWRAELLTLKPNRLEFWQSHVTSVPIELRAGSYLLLGKSYAKLGMTDEASFAFLRLPTQYPHHVALVSSAVSTCAALLARENQQMEAEACRRILAKLNQDPKNVTRLGTQ